MLVLTSVPLIRPDLDGCRSETASGGSVVAVVESCGHCRHPGAELRSFFMTSAKYQLAVFPKVHNKYQYASIQLFTSCVDFAEKRSL